MCLGGPILVSVIVYQFCSGVIYIIVYFFLDYVFVFYLLFGSTLSLHV